MADHLGHYAEAVACYQQALALYTGLGDRYLQAATLIHLGDTDTTAGDIGAAGAVWQQALAILADLDHPDAVQVRAKLSHISVSA